LNNIDQKIELNSFEKYFLTTVLCFQGGFSKV